MANTLRPYLTCIRNTLTAAINLSSFSCEEVGAFQRTQSSGSAPIYFFSMMTMTCAAGVVVVVEQVERYGRPEVEFQTNEHAMMNPVLITRNEREMCLIESSINSVRVSVKIKQVCVRSCLKTKGMYMYVYGVWIMTMWRVVNLPGFVSLPLQSFESGAGWLGHIHPLSLFDRVCRFFFFLSSLSLSLFPDLRKHRACCTTHVDLI